VKVKSKVKSPKKGGRYVSGDDYVEENEVYNKKMAKKSLKEMSTAGIARNLMKSEKEMGYSKRPKVKPQKKGK